MKTPLTLALMLAFAFLFPALRAADEPAKPITPDKPVELFNGKDTTGWFSQLKDPKVAADAVWSVKDGILACTGRPNGYLRTEKSYTQYHLLVEWRFTKAGNTGVLVHINPPDTVWPRCIECQGLHAHQGDFWIWGGAKVAEPMVQKNGVLRKAPDAEKPVGEWNTYEVNCRDDTVTIIVNGKEVNKVTGVSPTSGQVGIQSEGAAIEVRKVVIGPLP